ncbi:hypothetical protein Trydic_g23168 [Trypoxylus dichotomus]
MLAYRRTAGTKGRSLLTAVVNIPEISVRFTEDATRRFVPIGEEKKIVVFGARKKGIAVMQERRSTLESKFCMTFHICKTPISVWSLGQIVELTAHHIVRSESNLY